MNSALRCAVVSISVKLQKFFRADDRKGSGAPTRPRVSECGIHTRSHVGKRNRRGRSQKLNSFDVLAGFGIDADDVAFFDEHGDSDVGTGFKRNDL